MGGSSPLGCGSVRRPADHRSDLIDTPPLFRDTVSQPDGVSQAHGTHLSRPASRHVRPRPGTGTSRADLDPGAVECSWGLIVRTYGSAPGAVMPRAEDQGSGEAPRPGRPHAGRRFAAGKRAGSPASRIRRRRAARPPGFVAGGPPGFVAGAPDVAGRRVVVVVVGVVVLAGPRICQCHRCLLVSGTRGMRGGLWPGPSVPGSGLRLFAPARRAGAVAVTGRPPAVPPGGLPSPVLPAAAGPGPRGGPGLHPAAPADGQAGTGPPGAAQGDGDGERPAGLDR